MRLSPETEKGMYDMKSETPTRTASSGFVLPSNNEWVKAAYYDPKHGGTDSYWAYPTGPFDPPNIVGAGSPTGDVDKRGQAAARDLQPERSEQQRGHARLASRSRPRPGVRRRPDPSCAATFPPISRRGSTSRSSTWGT